MERDRRGDAIARVRTRDNADLERLIMDLQRDGSVDADALADRLSPRRPGCALVGVNGGLVLSGVGVIAGGRRRSAGVW